jgi:hypothetical protein
MDPDVVKGPEIKDTVKKRVIIRGVVAFCKRLAAKKE